MRRGLLTWQGIPLEMTRAMPYREVLTVWHDHVPLALGARRGDAQRVGRECARALLVAGEREACAYKK